MKVTIYHNPKCSTSRNVLAALHERGLEPEVIEYLKTVPTREDIRNMARDSGLGLRGLLRRRNTPYDELGLDDESLSEDRLLDAVEANPVLLNRPVVVTPKGTRLVRPVDVLDDIL
ncbi:MAG: arsenate reductase (glutaredoxin) [Paracoccus sp. (in: a-proteobacteria)]